MDELMRQVDDLYERAVFNEQPGELGLFERAAARYRSAGDARGEGEAQLWIGCFHQVVRDDNATEARSELTRG